MRILSFLNLKKYFHKKEKISGNFLHDWKVILVVSILLVIILGGLSVLLFFQIDKGKIFRTEGTISVSLEKINTNLLNKILDFYKSRETKTDMVNRGEFAIPDPAI
jgi:hypothetical protein